MTPHLMHRPHGSEHPYATTADQRVPVLPEVGEPVVLHVVTTGDVTEVRCEWVTEYSARSVPSTLVLHSVDEHTQRAAALTAIGGEGHLAEAQASAGATDGAGWVVGSPATEAGTRYRYRFIGVTGDGTETATDWFSFEPVQWTDEAPTGADLAIDATHLVPGSVRWRRASTPEGLGAADRVRFDMPLADGEHVVGFGERFDRLDQRGAAPDCVVFEQYKSQGAWGRTYLPMPFAHVVGGSGWGFHVETSRRSWFDIARSESPVLRVDAALGEIPQLRVATYHGAPAQVLRDFGTDAGRAEPLPEWVFRLWASGNEWNTQRIVMDQLDRHRDEDIPVGAVVIEAWSDECTFTAFRDAHYTRRDGDTPPAATDFTYPADGAWPDPKGMIDELHARGIKVVLWQIPLQRIDAPPELDVVGQADATVQLLTERGYAVKEDDGTPYRNRGWWFPQALMPDLTDPAARAWWAGQRRYLVRDLGIDGFKTDGGEHAWGRDLRFAAGRGDEVNNLFPVAYAQTFGDLLRSEGTAPVTFSRAGFTGMQAHGIVWAGDEDSTWEAFASSITAGLTASACGIVYWGWDIAGFSGPVPDPELYLRATAASVFMPIMQYHSEFNHHRPPLRDRTPWNVAKQSGDATVVARFRDCVRLRERLVPYLAEQAASAIETGRPLMRALMFDWPNDPRIWDFPRQYLLGDDLLVAPVTQPGARQWPVYLPGGAWIDVWTGQEVEGGNVVQRDVETELVPVYCRAESWPQREGTFRSR